LNKALLLKSPRLIAAGKASSFPIAEKNQKATAAPLATMVVLLFLHHIRNRQGGFIGYDR
jgi:hypothetical protein